VVGGLLALLAAATFALNNASFRRGALTGSVAQAMAVTVPIGVPLFFIITALAGYLGTLAKFSPRAILWLSLAGIVHFVWGRYCNYRAIQAIGVNLVTPVQQISLVITLALAIGLLGESLTPLQLIGIGLVFLGPALTAERSSGRQAPLPNGGGDAFKPRLAEGYVFAFLSATGYGTSPILIRAGLDQIGAGGSLAGGLISYIAATAVIAPFLLRPGQIAHVLRLEREPAKWFTLSGVVVCLSQMFYFMSLALAPVSVVSPIMRLSLVFRVYFSWLLTPHHEVFGGRMLLATLVSLAGALALTVSTELVLAHVPLPEAIIAVARWRWP
jgi:uncharacterized membrane protein